MLAVWKVVASVVSAALLAGCDDGRSGGAAGAKGDTPVRYVICTAGEQNCFVAARFKTLDNCDRHKQWADMLCDSRSQPGVMTCRQDRGQSIGVAYCLQ